MREAQFGHRGETRCWRGRGDRRHVTMLGDETHSFFVFYSEQGVALADSSSRAFHVYSRGL